MVFHADYCIHIVDVSQMIQRLLLCKGLVLRLCQILGIPMFYLVSSSVVLSVGSPLKALQPKIPAPELQAA